MKKLILLFLLFYSFAYSQVDTANWSFLPNQTNGKFTALISKQLYYGISGGQYKQMSLSATSYDSTVFQLIPNQLDGRYTMIENIATYYGKDSGTVRMNLSDNPLLTASSIGIDTSLFVKRSAFSQEITSTGSNILFTSATTFDVVSPSGVTFNSTDGDFEVNVTEGAIELNSTNGGVSLNGINSAVNITAGAGNIQLTIGDSATHFVSFANNKTSAGGVTPATFKLYLHIKVDGVEYKIPLVNP